jgi:hypothetical protein
MLATYLVGAVGVGVGFYRMGDGRPDAMRLPLFLAVGLVGIVSFFRHAVFHRADAARMGWDQGQEQRQRNNFQIETGIANLAWGLVAIAAAAWRWPLAAQGSIMLVFALYMFGAAILHAADLPKRVGSTIATAAFAVCLLVLAFAALLRAQVRPF